MDWLQFTSSVISSLAWPVSAAGIALTIRRPVIDLLSRATSAEGWGTKFTFAARIEETTKLIAGAEPARTLPLPHASMTLSSGEVQTQTVVTEAIKDLTDELAESSATGTVIAAWAELERYLKEVGKAFGIEAARPVAFSNLRPFRDQGILSDDLIVAIGQLRQMRNDLVHGRLPGPVSLPSAQSYRAAVRETINSIQQMLQDSN